jgi:regulator of sigma E protease
MDTLQTIVSFVVALGILVTIHEYGHYWVARKVGVKILRFSVGFGKSIWSTKWGPDDTEFTLAVIPLGGYVKMLDEREGEVPEELRHRAFNTQSLGARTAIVVAGPLANLALAFVVYWIMYMMGVSGPRPILGEVTENSLAASAGLRTGDEIQRVNGEPAPTWDNVFRQSISAILDGGSITIQVAGANGSDKDAILDLESISIDDLGRGDFFDKVGFRPFRPTIEPKIARVTADGPAALAGLRRGDIIVSADGEAIDDWITWVEFIRKSAARRVDVVLARDGTQMHIWLTPEKVTSDGEEIGRIGAEVDLTDIATVPTGIERYGVFESIPRASERTGEVIVTTLKFIRKMVIGEASVKNLSGPISIATFAGQSAKMGLPRFLEFLGLVSISLGILNLLPIPLLDGGHLMYYLLEFMMRRPVPESVQMISQQVGFVLLLGLMGLAVYNDIMRMM